MCSFVSRYRVFLGQMYPMSMTDMRLIDSKISPTWCQVGVYTFYLLFSHYQNHNLLINLNYETRTTLFLSSISPLALTLY